MNKYLILLGLMLIASLSFAADGPANWMQAVQGRYSCMYDYNYNMLELMGPDNCAMISEGYSEELLGTYFTCEDCMYDDTYYMYMAGGCMTIGPEPPLITPEMLSAFRSAMGAFNSDSAAFKKIFNTEVRGCLANPGDCDCDRGNIQEGLSIIRSMYMGCISERPYCRPPDHRPPSEDEIE